MARQPKRHLNSETLFGNKTSLSPAFLVEATFSITGCPPINRRRGDKQRKKESIFIMQISKFLLYLQKKKKKMITRIVQTFWSAGKSPLKNSFGWLSAEYNILSWAFSCLCLRELFSDVELYTDIEGCKVLIHQLQLPYTKVHIIFDENFCLPHHWALAKIKTYSLQDTLFLHIDGDAYITKPLADRLLTAPLVAQNREIGTAYYHEMIDYILKYPQINIPECIKFGLENDAIASFNMGGFGGNDLRFIHDYCRKSFEFIKTNRMNDRKLPHTSVDCNILFEQMLFASMADGQKRDVTCLINRPIRDEGYRTEDFCNVVKHAQRGFFHILGGHKQEWNVCEKLRKAMLDKYPSYALKIMSMFPEMHSRLRIIPKEEELYLTVEHCIAQYEDFIGDTERLWRTLPFSDLYHIEKIISNYYTVFDNYSEQTNHAECNVIKNPNIRLFMIPKTWPYRAVGLMARKLGVKVRTYNFSIAVIPSLYDEGIKEIPIGDLGLNILDILGDYW